MLITATLKIAQQELSARVMVRKVTQRLHRLAPDIVCDRRPSSIAVEFLKIPDERLNQRLLSTAGILPNLRRIENNSTVDDPCSVPTVDDALRTLDDVELLVEIVIRKDRTGLEFFRNTFLPCARAFDILAFIDVFASACGEEAVVDNGACGRVIA